MTVRLLSCSWHDTDTDTSGNSMRLLLLLLMMGRGIGAVVHCGCRQTSSVCRVDRRGSVFAVRNGFGSRGRRWVVRERSEIRARGWGR